MAFAIPTRSSGGTPLALVWLAVMCAACGSGKPGTQSAASSAAQAPAIALGSGPATVSENEGEWRRPAGDFASTRFSRLSEINAGNVGGLRLAWTFSTGVARGHEARAARRGRHDVRRHPVSELCLRARPDAARGARSSGCYNPKPELAAQGVACCDVVNRGAAYADGKLVFNTLDDHTIALDARDGQEIWNTKVGDINMGETMTMAPLVVKGQGARRRIAAARCGVRGWLKALDLNTGRSPGARTAPAPTRTC